MFNFFKKAEEQTPVEVLPVSKESAAGALRTVDGGYMGPGAILDDPPDTANNNKKDQKRDYQSTKSVGGVEAGPTYILEKGSPRRSSTLNYLSDPMSGQGGQGKLYSNHPNDASMGSSTTVGSTIRRKKCCNPDYGICGGCCYPFTCFGFSENQNLVLVAAGLLMILSGLIVAIVVLLMTVMRNPELCNTKECIVAAGEIISSLDESVNPCDDFVQFSCGGWKRNHPVPAGMNGWDAFSQTADTTHFRLKELLEAPSGPDDVKAVNITRAFYAACTNNTAWEEAGIAPLLIELGRSGGFPMINATWTNTSFNWLESIIFMRRAYAADYLLGLGVSYDAKNSSVFAIHLGEGYIPSPREFILSPEPRYRMMELNRITSIANTLSESMSGAIVAKNSTTTTPKPTTRRGGALHSAEGEDVALERVFKEMENKKKMQMRRKETVITLDGIAPDMKHIDEFKMVQQEADAETIVASSRQSSQLQDDANQLYQFIYELANITMTSEQAGDQYGVYNPMTVRDLQKRTDALGPSAEKIDWLKYFNSVFRDVNVTLATTDRIIVGSPDYLDGMLRLLHKTPRRVVANFLGYMLVLNLGEEASSSFMSLRGSHGIKEQDVMPRYIGRQEIRPWYDCSSKANTFMGNAVGYLYLTTSFSEDTLAKAREMVSDVHSSFRKIMMLADWMDEQTRTAGLRKLDAMLQLVGHSVNATNVKDLEEQYKELPELSSTDHFSNILLLARFLSKESLVLIKETPQRDVFSMNPVTINAAYSFSQNAMLIPAGILQSPFYRRNTITALNYGAIGVVIGHEVSHGFDDAGKEVDDRGNLRQWWTDTSKQTYQEKAECFVEQYGNYPTEADLKGDEQELLGYKINGPVTQGENIADNGGIQAAYRAFQRRVATNRENPRLPGLELYSGEQLFFISFAQLWCTNYTPQGLKGTIMLGPHAPGPFRVKGCFHNTQQMREAFKCPRDTSANSNETCSLW